MIRSVFKFAKRISPRAISALESNLRREFAKRPVDDVVLKSFSFEAAISELPRLNLLIPELASGADFGGVATGIDIFLELAKHIRAKSRFDVRLIVSDVVYNTDPSIFERAALNKGFEDYEVYLISERKDSIATRKNDFFIVYNWWTCLNSIGLVSAQADHYAIRRRPLSWLIQDYEPNFYPFNSAHLLAREAYDTPPRLWGIFNSGSLEEYFRLQGHRAERSFVFEPVINDALRPSLGKVPGAARDKRIVVYGRPLVERNCFPALVRGLRRWAADFPQYRDWEVVSAGTPHKPIALGDGRSVSSVGKLSLEDYAALMLGSRVGVSLMASPHPSYPPLEMAHMGLRTVTNTFTCKDLSGWHPNIVSTPSVADAALAAAISRACELSEQSPTAPPRADFVRDDKYPFIPELAAALRAEIAG